MKRLNNKIMELVKLVEDFRINLWKHKMPSSILLTCVIIISLDRIVLDIERSIENVKKLKSF